MENSSAPERGNSTRGSECAKTFVLPEGHPAQFFAGLGPSSVGCVSTYYSGPCRVHNTSDTCSALLVAVEVRLCPWHRRAQAACQLARFDFRVGGAPPLAPGQTGARLEQKPLAERGAGRNPQRARQVRYRRAPHTVCILERHPCRAPSGIERVPRLRRPASARRIGGGGRPLCTPSGGEEEPHLPPRRRAARAAPCATDGDGAQGPPPAHP